MAALGFKQIGGLGIPRPLAAYAKVGARETALAMYMVSPDHLADSVLVTDHGIYVMDPNPANFCSNFASYGDLNRLSWRGLPQQKLGADDFLAVLRKCTPKEYPFVLAFLRAIVTSAEAIRELRRDEFIVQRSSVQAHQNVA